MRITRREFMKYCAAAAGALGLTTTDLLKLEKAMASNAAQGGTQVVWLNGASCTGCTVSLANTAYYSSIQDLLVPWADAADIVRINGDPVYNMPTFLNAIGHGVLTDTAANGPLDLVFMETLSSSVGATAINAAKTVLSGTSPFVLCIEGSIQTASNGNYCKIGNGADYGSTTTIAFQDEVFEFATSANCLAILAVGTCASFGGIPAAKGSETGAKGLISTGKISGGYQTTNTTGYWDYLRTEPTGTIANIRLTNLGAGYTASPTVAFSYGSANATANINTLTGKISSITLTNSGSGEYTVAPTISFTGGTTSTHASAVATLATGIDATLWTSLMRKTVCIPGCPPHPDWIVGTIVYLLTYLEPPLTDKWHRPLDFYGQYQCDNCLWQTNKPGISKTGATLKDIDGNDQSTWAKGGPTLATGNSPKLFKFKYNSQYEGCLGVMGCKGRKTKADCSYRRWNSDTKGDGGIGWCVQTRGGCHGCTDPRFPDGWGKFFAFK